MTTAWGQVLPEETDTRGRRDTGFYIFAAFAGMFAGWVDIKVGDLLFTALLVLVPCMLLGLMRPNRAWRWVVVVGVCVPLVELLGYLALKQKPGRAQIYESFLAFLPGFAGSYGGAMLRQAVGNIFGDK
jgi:zinc transporter ZupT